jgi:hypothetical protein
MHDYSLVRIIHDDRLAQLTREADTFRLAAAVRQRGARPSRAGRLFALLRRPLPAAKGQEAVAIPTVK